MKIRKILSLIMIILLCSTGLIFGCQKTPLEINILNEKDKEVSQIFLSLPVNNLNTEDEIQDDEETPDEENTEENGDKEVIDEGLKQAERLNEKKLLISTIVKRVKLFIFLVTLKIQSLAVV